MWLKWEVGKEPVNGGIVATQRILPGCSATSNTIMKIHSFKSLLQMKKQCAKLKIY